MSDTTNTTGVDEPVADPAGENPSLTLADIQNAIAVIDYAADQGAYKGWATIEKVFLVRTRMAAFITAATPPVDDAKLESDVGTTTETPVVEANAPVTGDPS